MNLVILVDYIQAFYVPTREWEHWLENTGVKRYTQRQCFGLANCLARGDKRARQRMVATVTTVFARHAVAAVSAGGSGGASVRE